MKTCGTCKHFNGDHTKDIAPCDLAEILGQARRLFSEDATSCKEFRDRTTGKRLIAITSRPMSPAFNAELARLITAYGISFDSSTARFIRWLTSALDAECLPWSVTDPENDGATSTQYVRVEWRERMFTIEVVGSYL